MKHAMSRSHQLLLQNSPFFSGADQLKELPNYRTSLLDSILFKVKISVCDSLKGPLPSKTKIELPASFLDREPEF